MKFELLVFCLLLIGAGSAITTGDCPHGMPRDNHLLTHSDTCYYFELSTLRDYETAKTTCASMGGNLVVIRDSATQQYLYQQITTHFNHHGPVWIGLSNDGSDTAYVWTTGETLQYSNWAPGTPNTTDNGCVAMDTNQGGVWEEFPCNMATFSDVTYPFICEHQVQQTLTTTATLGPIKASTCFTCGDHDAQTPCSRFELFPRNPVQCPDDKPYCMNDIYQEAGHQPSYYKRCVDEATCQQRWYIESSDKLQCFAYDAAIYRDTLVCHLCCYGDECNHDLLPNETTLYKP